MKIKNILLTILSFISLISCASNSSNNSLNNNSLTTLTSNVENITTSENTSVSTNTSDNTSIEETSSKEWTDGRTKLECGYYQMDLPKNYQNPYNLKTTLSQDNDSWSNNDLKETLPDGFRYIYKNACDDGPTNHKASAKFYSSNNNAPGGLKIDNLGVGFQSQMFTHTGEKLEIRIGLSQVNNSSDQPEEGKDPFHIYFFDNKGNYLFKHIIEEGSVNANTTEIKFYWTQEASKISYFEFRCNAMPYKGKQCYNIGISYCNFKSWERI